MNYPGRRTHGATWSRSFPYPGNQSFWLPNHRQLIGFGGEGDLYINNSLCPWLHLISLSATVSETTSMHTAGEKMQSSNGNEPLSLNYLILCFFAPSVLLFVSPLFFSPHLHLCLLIHSGPLVIAFLCRFYRRFAGTNSQSPTLTFFPATQSKNKNSGKMTALAILSGFHIKNMYANFNC